MISATKLSHQRLQSSPNLEQGDNSELKTQTVFVHFQLMSRISRVQVNGLMWRAALSHES